VSLIYDNRAQLDERIARLKSGTVLAQNPAAHMRRLISNIEIGPLSESEIKAESNFILVEARGTYQHVWCGRTIHTLHRSDDLLKIIQKKVLLVNTDQEMPVLQFLI
jgi:3-phenylpropionate/cinnamic acid dioxygenase small subunit